MSKSKKNIFISQFPSKDKEIKDELYEIFLELRQKVVNLKNYPNQPVNYQNKNNDNNCLTAIKTLLHLIHELINLIPDKIKSQPIINTSRIQNNNQKNNNTINSKSTFESPRTEKSKPKHENSRQLENHILKLENDTRIYLKKIFSQKIQKEILQSKIQNSIKTEQEFESLKEKVKYQNGKFLDNDRMENEILILRQENSNLKNEITVLESKIVKNNDNIQTIKNLKEKIKMLLKISKYNNTQDNNNLANCSHCTDKKKVKCYSMKNIKNREINTTFNHHSNSINYNSSSVYNINNYNNINYLNGSHYKRGKYIRIHSNSSLYDNTSGRYVKNNSKEINVFEPGSGDTSASFKKINIKDTRNCNSVGQRSIKAKKRISNKDKYNIISVRMNDESYNNNTFSCMKDQSNKNNNNKKKVVNQNHGNMNVNVNSHSFLPIKNIRNKKERYSQKKI